MAAQKFWKRTSVKNVSKGVEQTRRVIREDFDRDREQRNGAEEGFEELPSGQREGGGVCAGEVSAGK